MNIKQELKLSNPLILNKKDKKQETDLTECHKKKKRKQRSPAKVAMHSQYIDFKRNGISATDFFSFLFKTESYVDHVNVST